MTTNQITVTDYYTGKALSLPIRTVYTDREGYVCVVNPYTVHSFRVRESEASLRAAVKA